MTPPPESNSPTPADSWSIHYRQGFDEGYRRALKDLVASLATISDRFVSQPSPAALTPSVAEARRVLDPFEQYLARQITRMTPDDGYVEGGMGI